MPGSSKRSLSLSFPTKFNMHISSPQTCYMLRYNSIETCAKQNTSETRRRVIWYNFTSGSEKHNTFTCRDIAQFIPV
jgi:hypothetical protein